MLQTLPFEWVVIVAAGVLALVVVISAALIMRAESARARFAAKLHVADERARAAEQAAKDLISLRTENERLVQETAAQYAAALHASERIAGLKAELQDAKASEAALRAERDALDRELSGLKAENRGFERQIADLQGVRDDLRKQFYETANTLLQSNSETLKSQNSEQIDALLKPLKNDIDAFKKSLGEAHIASAEQHGSLKQQIEQLARQSANVSKEAENLTRALKADSQLQGAWGELKVETILQRLGLNEGIEYTRQECFSDSEGRVRTDFIVNLPQGERLIIDSKVSLVDFEAYVNAEDESARSARLAAHARSLRNHVKGLASKEYHARVGTRLDFVIMFVPIEGALAVALRADEALTMDALDLKVAIATPTTLTTQLKTVAAMWRIERQHKNAEDIAGRAGALYDKFVNFVADIEKIGERIGQAQKSYGDAMSKLASGPGNLIRQAEMLKALGASTSKSLPAQMIEAAGVPDRNSVTVLGTSDENEVKAIKAAQ